MRHPNHDQIMDEIRVLLRQDILDLIERLILKRVSLYIDEIYTQQQEKESPAPIKEWTSSANRKLGPVDWNFDFMRLFDRLSLSPMRRASLCEQHVNEMKGVEAALASGMRVDLRIREGLATVIDTGMYRRTPKARPRPGMLIKDNHGRHRWIGFTAFKVGSVNIKPDPVPFG